MPRLLETWMLDIWIKVARHEAKKGIASTEYLNRNDRALNVVIEKWKFEWAMGISILKLLTGVRTSTFQYFILWLSSAYSATTLSHTIYISFAFPCPLSLKMKNFTDWMFLKETEWYIFQLVSHILSAYLSITNQYPTFDRGSCSIFINIRWSGLLSLHIYWFSVKRFYKRINGTPRLLYARRKAY